MGYKRMVGVLAGVCAASNIAMIHRKNNFSRGRWEEGRTGRGIERRNGVG